MIWPFTGEDNLNMKDHNQDRSTLLRIVVVPHLKNVEWINNLHLTKFKKKRNLEYFQSSKNKYNKVLIYQPGVLFHLSNETKWVFPVTKK